MFTQSPSPVRQATARRSHDYQVTLSLPLHTLCGPGATPLGQVLLSERFRQTLLTTSLEVVQAIINDRVLEAGIYINLAHSFTQSMTTIPRMIVLRRQDSPESNPSNVGPIFHLTRSGVTRVALSVGRLSWRPHIPTGGMYCATSAVETIMAEGTLEYTLLDYTRPKWEHWLLREGPSYYGWQICPVSTKDPPQNPAEVRRIRSQARHETKN